jgi:hypothetical protein
MRAHFTICAKQPAGSDLVDPRRRNSQVKRGRPQGPRMRCGWGCGAQLIGRNTRAHLTICAKRSAIADQVDRRGRSQRAKRGRPPGRRMLCGWRCGTRLTASRRRAHFSQGRGTVGTGAQLTGRNMRAHFTMCPKRPPGCSNPGSNHAHHRRKSPKVKRGRPPRPLMKCGWGCGAQLTGRQMRAHFLICPKRPAACDHVDRRGRNLNAKRGRPPGRRMLCGWRCGALLTASQMRIHFTKCSGRPWV